MIGRTNAMKIDGGGGDWKVITLHGGVGETITATDSDGVQYACVTNSLGDGIIVVELGKTYTFIGSRGQYSVVATINNTLTELNIYNESYEYWCGRKLKEPYQVIPNMLSASQDGWTVSNSGWNGYDYYKEVTESWKDYNAFKSGNAAKMCPYCESTSYAEITIYNTSKPPFCTNIATYISSGYGTVKTGSLYAQNTSGSNIKSITNISHNTLMKIDNVNSVIRGFKIASYFDYSNRNYVYSIYAANNRSDVGIFGYAYGKYKV